MKRIFIKQTERTTGNGIAGLMIRTITGKLPTDSGIELEVLVVDLDGMPAGPYQVLETDTEIREVEDLRNPYKHSSRDGEIS